MCATTWPWSRRTSSCCRRCDCAPTFRDRGARAYSIGFPLNLGLTITEGVANGLVSNGFDQRIHYTGAINSGMSGGPALDAGGAVYGVNVSVIAARQLVGFVVPARHIAPLLARARAPLEKTHSARQARDMVAAQVLAYQSALFEPGPQQEATQTVFGFTLPTQIGPAIECSTTGASETTQQLRTETIGCSARARVSVQTGLEVGDIRFQHRVMRTDGLHPLQFAQRVNADRTGLSALRLVAACRAVRLRRGAGVPGRLRCARQDLRATIPPVLQSL